MLSLISSAPFPIRALRKCVDDFATSEMYCGESVREFDIYVPLLRFSTQ